MFLKKQIEGKVTECIIRREYMLPRRLTRICREFHFDYDYEYEQSDEFENACDYYIEYQTLAVAFQFLGEERIENFNDITLHSHYKISDKVTLVYNKLDKTFRLKG